MFIVVFPSSTITSDSCPSFTTVLLPLQSYLIMVPSGWMITFELSFLDVVMVPSLVLVIVLPSGV
jgi:hypothetical protein